MTTDYATDAALKARLMQETRRRCDQAEPLLRAARRALPRLELRFDLTGRSAGQVVWRSPHRLCIRYNLGLALAQPDSFVAETVPHEVAHVVAYACHGRVRPHGPEWQAVMRHFGFAEPRRCHDFALTDTAVRRQRRWTYACGCADHQLSTTRHNRIQQERQRYVCRVCGEPLEYRP